MVLYCADHEMLQNKIESIQAESACLLEEKGFATASHWIHTGFFISFDYFCTESVIKDLQIELDKANSLLSSNSRGKLQQISYVACPFNNPFICRSSYR